jgi:hypothetical protein
VLTVSPFDFGFLVRHIRRLEKGTSIPDAKLDSLLMQAGYGRDSLFELRPFEEAIERRLFEWAREISARAGARVVLMTVRLPGDKGIGNLPTTLRAANAAQIPLIECTTVFTGRRAADYRAGEFDAHPNVDGHRLLSSCLIDGLAVHASGVGLEWMPLKFNTR